MQLKVEPRRTGFLRNIIAMVAANGVAKPLWFLFITLACMRYLGAEGYGMLNVLLSLSAITTSFADLGLSDYTIRNIARNYDRARNLFSNAFSIRVAGAILAFLTTVAVGIAMGYSKGVLIGLCLAGVYHIFVGLVQFLRNYFRAFENLVMESYSITLEKFVVVAIAFLFLSLTGSLLWTIAGLVAGSGIVFVLTIAQIQSQGQLLDASAVSRRYSTHIAKASIPFAAASLFSILYLRSDIVIVGVLAGDLYAGQYAAAYRILEAINILPVIVAQAAFLPMISRLAKAGTLHDTFKKLFTLCVAVVCIGAFGAVLLASGSGTIISFLDPSPEFAPAARALAILAWSFPLIFLQNVLFVTLIAFGEHVYRAALLGIGLLINIALTVYLLPRVGIAGAAYATIVAECVFTVGYGWRILSIYRNSGLQ